MRSLVGSLLLALVVTAAMPAFADTPAAPASADPLKVGAPVTVKKPVDIAALAKKPAKFVGRTVLLEGTVKDVCQGRGCCGSGGGSGSGCRGGPTCCPWYGWGSAKGWGWDSVLGWE